MADDEVNGDSDEVHAEDDVDVKEKISKHDWGAADLEKVTDYAEEKEIGSSADFSVIILLVWALHIARLFNMRL